MAYDLPTAWKMDGLELSIEQKLNYLAAHVAALEEAGGGGSTVSVTADYTEQSYNNKLATITVDDTATSINAPKVTVTPTYNYANFNVENLGNISVGSTTKGIYARKGAYYTQESESILSATYEDLSDCVTQGMTAICYTYVEDPETQLGTYVFYYLDKLWITASGDDVVYHAKFGTKSYSASNNYDSMELDA